jgi:hypothetical protein
VSVRSRIAFASGAAGAVGTTLLLSGRYEGSVVLALLLAFSIRTAALGTLAAAGPIIAGEAVRALRARAWLAPAWAVAVAAVIMRAGSTSLADLRGANAVIGPALFNGPLVTVFGTWLAFAGAALALLAWTPLGTETAAASDAVGRVVAPAPVRRLEVAGLLAEAALIVSLFVGPQIVEGVDAIWWAGGILVLLAACWYGRRARLVVPFSVPVVAGAIATAGLVLVVAGGRP